MNEEHIEKHLNRPDRKFEFHDKVTYIEHQDITVQKGAAFYNGPQADCNLVKEESLDEIKQNENPLIEELMPVFMNVRTEVVAFIDAIDGQKPTAVTEKVNELIKEKKILKSSSKRLLWSILHKYNLYTKSETNWNLQVN